MAKLHEKGVKPPRNVTLKCPLCGGVHSATEWHTQSLKRWKTIRKLPLSREICWFECPSCTKSSKGSDLIPVITIGGTVQGEGWFSYYHTPSEGEVQNEQS